jgi:hypothetical protein
MMRPLWFDDPDDADDAESWNHPYQYRFGPDRRSSSRRRVDRRLVAPDVRTWNRASRLAGSIV